MNKLKTILLLLLILQLLESCNDRTNAFEEGRQKNREKIKVKKLPTLIDRYFSDNNDSEQNLKDVDDFEYSNHWRQEAYKITIEVVAKNLINNKPRCKVIRRGTYNSNSVQYIGGSSYKVTYYCEFDCNQNYINPAYFTVRTTYLGNNRWDAKIIDYRLTH